MNPNIVYNLARNIDSNTNETQKGNEIQIQFNVWQVKV